MLLKKPWNFVQVMLLLVAIIFCINLLSLLAHFAGVKPGDTSTKAMVMGTLALDGSILFVVWLFLLLTRTSWTEAFGFGTPGQGRAVLLGFVAGVVFVPIGDLMKGYSGMALERFFHTAPHEQVAVETLLHSVPGPARIWLVFSAAVLAPVAEEMLFRGILYPTIKQCNLPRTALWSTSILFALIHEDLASFIPLMILALGLTLLYEKTTNLLACITAHAVFNTTNVILFFSSQH